jgi:hypothetical protein
LFFTAAGKLDITILPADLPTSGSVIVTAQLTKGGQSSTTSISVPINGKPICTAATPEECLSVTAGAVDTFPAAIWSAMPVNIEDDDATPLR